MKSPIVFLLAALPSTALAWPASTDWEALTQAGAPMEDPEQDGHLIVGSPEEDCWDIVGEATVPAVAWYVDDSFLYLRMVLNANPLVCAGFSMGQWGFLLETDGTTTTYEHMLAIFGGSTDTQLWANSDGGTGVREEAEDLVVSTASTKLGMLSM